MSIARDDSKEVVGLGHENRLCRLYLTSKRRGQVGSCLEFRLILKYGSTTYICRMSCEAEEIPTTVSVRQGARELKIKTSKIKKTIKTN